MADPLPEKQGPVAMLQASEVDRLFPYVAVGALFVFMNLVYAVYNLTPETDLVVLEGVERNAPLCAATILATGLLFFYLPFFKFFRAGQQVTRPSGIVTAASVAVLVAISTNLLISLCPTVVWIDPVTNARVFALRWCEWIPLSGLMTFMSDAVDAPRQSGLRPAIIHSLSQVTAVVCGLVFPFCPDVYTWLFVQFISMATYIPIFPRVEKKRKALEEDYKRIPYNSVKENLHRKYFAYHLLRTCATVWTTLVVMYYLHCVWYLYFPEGHPLHFKGSAMLVDTFFDVLAKCFYLKVIVEVHQNVFDSDARRQRQLHELRRLMQVLWDSTTDAIVISVKDKERTSSFLSPSFQDLVGAAPRVRPAAPSAGSAGVMLETSTCSGEELKDMQVFDARFIDSTHISSTDALESLTISSIGLKSEIVQVASELIHACWSRLSDENSEASFMLMQELTKPDREKCYYELKVCRKSSESFVALARDVTERHLRFEAEKRAQAEALARQKDAQTVNRFTRHEIKNGLLCGIELCDSIQESLENTSRSFEKQLSQTAVEHELTKMTGTFGEIDRVLHEILDTVLAEAMARDVIHECYNPHPKKTDVLTTLKVTAGSEERFVLESSGDVPDLMLDTQLLRYIHRNAISNACKYGKTGGAVSTLVSYEKKTSILQVKVVNDPGIGHERLLQMGDEASKAVFEAGKRLHSDLSLGDSSLSSGDGAWIMQKCAKNMKGSCSISFEKDQTVFEFYCHADPADSDDFEEEEFELPPNTWALGIDDSWIQRKLLMRIFANAGVHQQRKKVIGRDLAELDFTEALISEYLDKGPNVKVLVLVDENLDYAVEGEGRIIRSGSKMMEAILEKMPPNRKDRILCLVRSANDSAEDIAVYNQRTHGFFSKTATRSEQIMAMLKPCWAERFGRRSVLAMEILGDDSDLETDDISKEDLRGVVAGVDMLLQEGNTFRDVPWSHLWSALHSLKGDMMTSGDEALQAAAEEVNSLRGPKAPDDFESRWSSIRQKMMDAIDKMG